MQANWSLILNALLLIGVIVAIGRLMKARRQSLNSARYQPNSGAVEKNTFDGSRFNDDIIAVRKLNADSLVDEALSLKKSGLKAAKPRLMPQEDEQVRLKAKGKVSPKIDSDRAEDTNEVGATVMMFLLAKEKRQFAGYELLQTVLAAGLRFGENGLFHRHQFTNGDGAIVCSLAAATETGVFDLQNIGAFSVRGLCLYMESSNDAEIDGERFSIMLDTARQLSDGLDAYLLDDQRRPLTEERMVNYYERLHLNHSQLESVSM